MVHLVLTGLAFLLSPSACTPPRAAAASASARASHAHLRERAAHATRDSDAAGYVEYVPGDLPIVLSAPHGGYVQPAGMAPRTCGIRGPAPGAADAGSQELTRAVAAHLVALTGRAPYVVINHLHRNRLDANRPLAEATCGNPAAAPAWHAFHRALETATRDVVARWGRGQYFDLHRNDHVAERWTEIDFGLTPAQLALPDAALNALAPGSNLRDLVGASGAPLADLVRGPRSLGARLAAAGFRAVPSPEAPEPARGAFFSGGYNARRYGARPGINAALVENSYAFLGPQMPAYARALARTMVEFVEDFYGVRLARTPAADRVARGDSAARAQRAMLRPK